MSEVPAAEYRRQGYAAAREELRMLLAKVPEEQMLGVVAAWLHEGGNEKGGRDERDHALPAAVLP